MNRHLKSIITVLLFVLLLFGIYIVPVRKGDTTNSGSDQPAVIDRVDLSARDVQQVSIDK